MSLGLIEDDEIIGRGAFDPRNGNANTLNIRPALIPKEDLLGGKFSVWRLTPKGIKSDELVARLSGVSGQNLFALVGATAGQIRAIRAEEMRALSVVDECECDQQGNKHEAHAHIGICKSLLANGLDKASPVFEQIRAELYGLLKSSMIWTS